MGKIVSAKAKLHKLFSRKVRSCTTCGLYDIYHDGIWKNQTTFCVITVWTIIWLFNIYDI